MDGSVRPIPFAPMRMRTPHRLLAGALLAATSAAPAVTHAQATTAAPAIPFIESVGSAESRAVPDRAMVTLSVETTGATASGVATTNARVQRQVLDTLAKLGFQAPNVSTRSFNVAPNWDVGPQGRRQAGYIARNAVVVRVTDLARIGAIIDAALARGATGVGNLDFASGAADSAGRVAVREATAKAREEAAAMASALGGSLGGLLQASTMPDQRAFGRMAYAGSMRMENTPITPTDIVVSATVVTRWQFVPGR